jgi:LysM repeat protein
MKKFLFISLMLFFSICAFAQSQLLIQRSERGIHLKHTVAPKENFYSIGRLYNISPRDIATFNNLDLNLGLGAGQVLLIPLTASNFSQNTDRGTPVYYVVKDSEGLFRVSVNNNNVLMSNLRKWNNLTDDNITSGSRLIVGYLTPAESLENPGGSTLSTPVQRTPEQTQTRNNTPVNAKSLTALEASGGHFRNDYDQQTRNGSAGKSITGTGGIFKTASGWTDGKYYALIDGVEPGTVIKVTNPTSNRSVYAKVLGEMSGIRQNAGLDVRISNAAASVLGINETDKFIVNVNY